jgi:hypothetical protein
MIVNNIHKKKVGRYGSANCWKENHAKFCVWMISYDLCWDSLFTNCLDFNKFKEGTNFMNIVA